MTARARHPQRGMAVVLAMGVVALAAMAAAAILLPLGTWARHSELAADRTQALLVVKAGVDWARAVLSDDRAGSSVDHLGEPWALRLPPLPVDNGQLAGHLDDQQARYNLNNLVRNGKIDAMQLAHFRQLLEILALPPALAPALADWLDADSAPQAAGGAEDAHYLAASPPYLAANRALSDVGELALVRGFDEHVRARLAPYITALPRFTSVNVNTAPAEVLAAVIPNLGLSAARALVTARDRHFIRDRGEFRRLLPNGIEVSENDITISSDYFMAHIRVAYGSAQATGSALLARQGAGWPAILWLKS